MAIEIQTHDQPPNYLRQLMVGGEAASWLWVGDRPIRLLGETVRMGGIAGVNTKQDQRMKGYARRLLSDTVTYMTEQGYDVSMLFGIPDFYDKFGYIPCIPGYRVTIATRDAERAGEAAKGWSVRPLTPDDYAFVVRVSNAANADRAASLIRYAGKWSGFRHGSDWWRKATAAVVEDPEGRPAGYMAWDKGVTEVKAVEVEAADARAYPAILAELARMAVEMRCGEIETLLPPDHLFSVFARRYGCRASTRFDRMGGGMMRILNQGPLFEKLQPGMERRLQRSGLAGRRVRLKLETDLGTTRALLNADGEGESRVTLKMRQDRLMQLVVGYRPASDVLGEDGVESRGPAQEVLEALFGGQTPYVLKPDEF